MGQGTGLPARAWVVTGAGMTVNLCLGILYAWSVWKANLIAPVGIEPGTPMAGLNEGWTYLSDAQATWAYAICGFTFALFMIPGGRLQDRYGPRVGATLAGLCLGLGCVLAGMMKSYFGADPRFRRTRRDRDGVRVRRRNARCRSLVWAPPPRTARWVGGRRIRRGRS